MLFYIAFGSECVLFHSSHFCFKSVHFGQQADAEFCHNIDIIIKETEEYLHVGAKWPYLQVFNREATSKVS